MISMVAAPIATTMPTKATHLAVLRVSRIMVSNKAVSPDGIGDWHFVHAWMLLESGCTIDFIV